MFTASNQHLLRSRQARRAHKVSLKFSKKSSGAIGLISITLRSLRLLMSQQTKLKLMKTLKKNHSTKKRFTYRNANLTRLQSTTKQIRSSTLNLQLVLRVVIWIKQNIRWRGVATKKRVCMTANSGLGEAMGTQTLNLSNTTKCMRLIIALRKLGWKMSMKKRWPKL